MSKNQRRGRAETVAPELRQPGMSPRTLLWLTAGLLFLFGLSHSITYFGHQQVPNPDFTAFASLGHTLWSFDMPQNFKRTPLLGLLIVPLGWLCGGNHPDLTGGWLLNAILHPLTGILFWLAGKRVIGRAGLWIALLALINPYLIELLATPIAETTFIFFIALTFYLMFRHSKWAYAAAALTSIVRYEGAALILAAFVMDLAYAENRRKKLQAFGYAALASVPLLLWLLGTVLHWNQQGSGHYLNFFSADQLKKVPDSLHLLWTVTFSPFLVLPPGLPQGLSLALTRIGMVLAGGLFLVGAAEGIWKRNWKVIALLIFFVPYVLVHILFEYSFPRFYVIVSWILLLLCGYGAIVLWRYTAGRVRIPAPVSIVAQILLVLILLLWFLALAQYLPQLKPLSPRSAVMPYAAFVAVALLGILNFYATRLRDWRRGLLIGAAMVLLITTNQFRLAPLLGHGSIYVEFKHLAQWFAQEAPDRGGIAASMANEMRLFVPEEKKDEIVHTSSIQASDPADFVARCRRKNIRYVAWDTWIGLRPNDRYYQEWGIENIAMLSRPQDVGPYRFVRKFQNPHNKYYYIHLFEIVVESPPVNRQ